MSKHGNIVKMFGSRMAELAFGGFLKVWRVPGTNWEIVEKKDAVAVLVYNRDRQAAVFVNQERPATGGILTEVAAGHIEASGEQPSNREVVETMAREIQEELGINVPWQRIELLTQGVFTSPGISTEKIWLGYVEVCDEDMEAEERDFGLAEEGEVTRRFWIGVDSLDAVSRSAFRDMKTFALVQWFLLNKYPDIKRT